MVRGARWRWCAALALGALVWWAWRGAASGRGPPAGAAVAPVAGRELPLVFIGGVPRSGTTLMRAMLDAHPEVRCGQETRVVPRILQMRQHWMRSQKESVRLEQAGVSKAVLDNAIAAFCLEVIVRHGEPAPRLCNKDPLVLKMGTYVLELFPNAKFLFMVRDGRATVHSIITRKVSAAPLPRLSLHSAPVRCRIESHFMRLAGDDNGLRSDELQAVPEQVEPRGGADVPAVQVAGRDALPAGTL